jgi:hypothetical protein
MRGQFVGETIMRTQGQSAPVYRVRASDSARWDVFCEPSPQAIASFNEKHDALSYAMSLARGGAEWHLFSNRHRTALARGSEIGRTLPA